MRYVLSKEFKFEASHQLVGHDGKCARLHGHSWLLRISVQGDRLQEDGPKKNMLLDYGDVSAVVKPLVEEFLDHHHLNTTLDTDSPTSEYVARWVWNRLPMFAGARVCAVEVEETCTSRCRLEAE